MSTPVESFSPFAAADYLTSVDDVVAYLEAVVEQADDDPALIAQALGAVARSRNVSDLAPRRHEPRRPVQGAVCRRQPQLRHRSQVVQSPRTQSPLRVRRLNPARPHRAEHKRELVNYPNVNGRRRRNNY
jgi:DNA-binding phage protein